MAIQPGDKLGSYEIISMIGQGGMGQVYKARDSKLKRDVALKVLPEVFARDPDRMARFQREAEVLASLNHPNIATIYGVEERALVMEFVEGASPKGPMPFETAWKVVSQIADALEYAHDKGVMHRDLKPANVLVTPDGVVKLLDFGLAKAFQAEMSSTGSGTDAPTVTLGATVAGTIMGTPAYMSPEQVKGKQADKRADIWAFGVVLYELLTGKRLFTGDDVAEVLAQVLTKEPDLSEVPANVRGLLAECLKKEARQRLRDIGDAKRLVGQTATSDLTVSDVAVRPTLRWVWPAAAALFAMVAAYGLWPQQVELKPLLRLSVDLGAGAELGGYTTAAISPDGTRIVYPARTPGVVQLVKRRLDESKTELLAPGALGGRDTFFSPDGQWIGFVHNGQLKKVAVSGGSAVNIAEAPGFRGGAWAEDGTIVFAANLTGGLSRVADTGGMVSMLTTIEGNGTDRWPQVLPGGKAVLFSSTSDAAVGFETGNIDVVSLETGVRKTVVRGGYFGRYVPSRGGGHILYLNQGTLFAVPFNAEALELRGTQVPLVDGVASDPFSGSAHVAVSTTNGTLVYSTGAGASVSYPISWLDSAGKVSPLIAQPGRYGVPRFSPDGKRLLYSAVGGKGIDLWVHDLERNTPAQLTFTAPGNYETAWSPDGKYVVYSSGTKLWWLRSDGSGQPKLLRESKFPLRSYSFSPDGRRLFFSDNTPTVDIWSMEIDLTDPENPKPGKAEGFQQSPAIDVDAAVSPDGRWVAYSSLEAGPNDVYVRPVSGSGKWKISTEGGKFPIWSRAANQLFFLATDDRIMVTDWTAQGDSFTSKTPRVWSETRILRTGIYPSFALHPDGKRFAVFPRAQEPENQGSLHATFLLNFADELQRRAPAK